MDVLVENMHEETAAVIDYAEEVSGGDVQKFAYDLLHSGALFFEIVQRWAYDEKARPFSAQEYFDDADYFPPDH